MPREGETMGLGYFAEFAYNGSVHRSTGCAPFSLVYTKVPSTLFDVTSVPNGVNSRAATFAEDVAHILEDVRSRLQKVYAKEKEMKDAQRKEVLFEPGDEVMVHFRKERMPANLGGNKLHPRRYGPFKVLKKLGDNPYVIDLPTGFGVSSAFNVADLAPYKTLEDGTSLEDKLIPRGGA